jgi:glutathione S-transferase
MTKLIVYGAWEHFGVPDFSPACLKLKTYLRMTGLEYEARKGDPRKAPTQKIPYVDDSGSLIGDSQLVIEHLKKKHGDKLDQRLTAQERAVGHAIRRTAEESLYWVMLYARWYEEENADALAKAFAPVMPPVIGGLVFRSIRGQAKKSAYAQGIARHTNENAYSMGKADLDSISELLGEKKYLFGDEPTSFDAAVFGQVANVFSQTTKLSEHGKSRKNLVAFCDRIRATYWKTPDEVA